MHRPGMRRLSSLTGRVPSWLLTDAVAPFVATRVALLYVGWLATAMLPQLDTYRASENFWLVNVLARWDSRWYLSVAQAGYGGLTDLGYTNLAFSPALPALMKLGAMLVHREDTEGYLRAGIVVSNIAGLLAVIYLAALLRRDFGAEIAGRATFYVLVFPTSFFLSAVFSESLFLLFTVAAVYYARTGRWWLAGAFGAFSTLARPLGVLLVVPLVWEYIRQRDRRPGVLHPSVLWLGLLPLAYVGWAFYLYRITGDPMASFTAQTSWARHLTFPWATIGDFVQRSLSPHGFTNSQLDLLFGAIFLVLVLASWRTTGPTYALAASVLYLPIVSTGTVQSVTRFCLVIFPAFVVLAQAGRAAWFNRVYVAGAAILGGFLMAIFAVGYWVA